MFEQRHYEFIARFMMNTQPESPDIMIKDPAWMARLEGQREQWEMMLEELKRDLKADNMRFNAERFEDTVRGKR